MTTEYKDPILVNAEFDEHSTKLHAKKVVSPLSPFPDPSNPDKSADPVNGTVSTSSASLTLEVGSWYRVIADVDVNYRQTLGASTAVATDIYLPAKTAIIVSAEKWDTLSFIGGGAGKIQAVKVG